MGKGRSRCRVGQVVGGDVHGLHRGNGTLGGGGDAFLHGAHVGTKRRLVTHGRRNTTEKGGHFRAGLGEAENVVYEEQHVLALVAEVLGNGQTGESNTGTGTGGLVHLAVNEGCLRAFAAAFLVHAGFDHLVVEVVTFTGTLTHACEHGVTAVRLRDVVDEFHDENGLAHAGAAEQADLAALCVRREKVHDLDAGHEDFGFGRLVDIFRSVLVDRAGGLGLDRTCIVNRLADDVHDATKGLFADRNRDRGSGVGHGLAADQTFGGVHGDGAHGVLAEVLGNLENQATAHVFSFQSVHDRRKVIVEAHIDNGADDLRDAAGCTGRRSGFRRGLGCRALGGSLASRGLLSRCGLGCRGSCLSHNSYPLVRSLERFRTRNDFDKFLGDLGLSLAVVAH